jgi:hypothetical protein
MTNAQRKHADNWLNGKCPNFKCPGGCGGGAPRATEAVDLPVPAGFGTVTSAHMIAFVCPDCGHASLFSAGFIGIPGLATP